MRILQTILTLAAISLTTTSFAEQAGFVVTNVRVFDGESMLASPTSVVIKGGYIAAIGETTNTSELRQIDGSGATLLPGLLDAHAHTESVAQLQEALTFGITTVLDMGTFPPFERALRKAARSDPGVADFRSAGIWATAPGGHGTEYGIEIPTVTTPEDAQTFVTARVNDGVDFLKIVINGVRHANNGTPTLDAATVSALVTSAHANGLLVVAHIESGADLRLAVSAGADGLVHHWRDGGAREELARLLAEKKIFVMPTLTAPDGFIGPGPKELLDDPLISPYLSELSRTQLSKELNIPPGMTMEAPKEGMRSLVKENVIILAGSDAFTGNPRIVHGASLHRLLKLFTEAGLTPPETLRSATANVADAFGLSDRGRIKPGLRADLLLVRGDPSVDISVTRDIIRVWRGGIEVARRATGK
jgi:imidazolonepropionase-like amidohydrolase